MKNQIEARIKRSGLYSAMPGSENLSIEKQITLIGALAEINGREDIINDAKAALQLLSN